MRLCRHPSRSPAGGGWGCGPDGRGNSEPGPAGAVSCGGCGAARAAAFFALSTPTVRDGHARAAFWHRSRAARRARPARSARERSGTPITGRSVCARDHAGQRRREPRAGRSARGARVSSAAGVFGDRVRSCGEPSAPRARAGSRALVELVHCRLHPARGPDSEPTEDPDDRPSAADMASAAAKRDVASELHARRTRSARGRVVRCGPGGRRGRSRERRSRSRIRAAARDEAVRRARAVPAWKTSAPVASAASIPSIGDAGVAALRIVAGSRARRVTAARIPMPEPPSSRARRAAAPAERARAGRLRASGRSDCVSGSPKRQLNSSTRGPSSVSIRPAKSTPDEWRSPRWPSLASDRVDAPSRAASTSGSPSPGTGE